MRRFSRILGIPLVGAAVCWLAASEVRAGNADSPDGEPPRGVAFQSDAKGTKLNGVISIELTEVVGFEAESARGILRLERGRDLPVTFFAEVAELHPCPSVADPDRRCVLWKFDSQIEEIQGALLAGYAADILDQFFDGQPLTITPKRISKSAEVPVTFSPTGCGELGDLPCKSLFLVMDVEVAVK
ncbi:MAG: hypothetical protein JSU66_04520 [Deltaproteobacteria bacterium]|nr:MAG: hypothetical protein JSU66_04520 [Deltaproteobacteria bacterium]